MVSILKELIEERKSATTISTIAAREIFIKICKLV